MDWRNEVYIFFFRYLQVQCFFDFTNRLIPHAALIFMHEKKNEESHIRKKKPPGICT